MKHAVHRPRRQFKKTDRRVPSSDLGPSGACVLFCMLAPIASLSAAASTNRAKQAAAGRRPGRVDRPTQRSGLGQVCSESISLCGESDPALGWDGPIRHALRARARGLGLQGRRYAGCAALGKPRGLPRLPRTGCAEPRLSRCANRLGGAEAVWAKALNPIPLPEISVAARRLVAAECSAFLEGIGVLTCSSPAVEQKVFAKGKPSPTAVEIDFNLETGEPRQWVPRPG